MAGIAGITTIVFYYLFREVIRKLALPRFSREHAYKTIRLILVLVFLLAVIGITAWTAIQLRGTQEGKASPKLSVKTRQVEHVYFFLYAPGEESLPDATPEYSMLKLHPGAFTVSYIVHNPWLPDIPAERMKQAPVVLPEGEAAYDFVVTNFGSSTTVVDSVSLELVEARELPPSRAGEFLPMFEPYKDSATIRRAQSSYSLFYNKTFAYEAGKTDAYRINVKVADAEDPGLFKCRLAIKHSSDGESFVSYSEPFFIAKYFGGHTNRNIYSKFNSDAAPTSSLPPALRYIDGTNFFSRPTFYSTGSNLAFFVDRHQSFLEIRKEACEWGGTPAKYAADHTMASLMDGPRDPVQKYGFVIADKPAPGNVLDKADLDSYSGAGNSKYYWAKRPLKSGREKDDLVVYDYRSMAEHDCVCLAVAEVVVRGTEDEKRELSQHLVGLSRSGEIDAAGLLDLIPLLAILNNEITLSRLEELLRDGNVMIREKACAAFGSYRYPPASGELLKIYLQGSNFLKGAAARGLTMSGDKDAAEAVINRALGHAERPEDIEWDARLIVNLSPDRAARFIKELPDDSALRRAMIKAAE